MEKTNLTLQKKEWGICNIPLRRNHVYNRNIKEWLGISEADELHSAITTTSYESIWTHLYISHPSLHTQETQTCDTNIEFNGGLIRTNWYEPNHKKSKLKI